MKVKGGSQSQWTHSEPSSEEGPPPKGPKVKPASNETTITHLSSYQKIIRISDSSGNSYQKGPTGPWQILNTMTRKYETFTGTVDLQGGKITPAEVFPQPNSPNDSIKVFPQPN